MARHQDKSSGIRRPPALPALAPPRAKPQRPDTGKRKLVALPELAPPNSDPFAPKISDEEFYRNAQQRMGQRRNSPNISLAPPPRSGKVRHVAGPRLGKGAHKHSRRRQRYRLNPAFIRVLSVSALVVILCVVAALGARYVLAYNALEVLLNGNHIGYMALNRELTSDEFHNDVVAYIEERSNPVGRIEIIPQERVEIALARRIPSRDMQDISWIKSNISRHMNYQLVARVIYIQDIPRATVQSQACVNYMKEAAKRQHRSNYTVDERFLIEWEIKSIEVDRDYHLLQPARDVLASLDHNTNFDTEYTVQPGDNKTVIANRFGTTPDRIAQVNNRLVSDILHPGDTLTIRSVIPLLTVVYTDEITEDVPIPMPVQEIENDTMLEHTNVVYREGRDGVQRLTKRVIRHNAVVVSSEELAAVVVQEPIPHIIEVGTRPAVIERR